MNKLTALLIKLSKEITPEDRKAAEYHLKLSNPTVWTYTKGKGTKVDTASALIFFFKNRISERKKSLA